MNQFPTIDQIDFKDKKAIVRVDFNVPLNAEREVTDNTRIKAAIPTIQKILMDGGAAVLMSHLGRPKNGVEDKFSLRHIVGELSELLDQSIHFVPNCVGAEAHKAVAELKPGQVLLLENLRFHAEEKKGDTVFAEKLAKLGADIYVNDAFGTAHRAHASTSVIAQFFDRKDRVFGQLMAGEIMNARRVLEEAESPFTAILGGAKVSDKILLIESLISKVDNIIIGGGMAYTFVKAQGGAIGSSLVEDDKLELASELLRSAVEQNTQILLPVDSVIADAFSNGAKINQSISRQIAEDWMGLDIGNQAIADFSKVINTSKTIIWNGPMGVFEMSNFQQGTKSIALAVAEATSKGAFSLIGGGDSVAAIKKFNLQDQVSFVSTGGGAMLEFFEGKELPGIQSIQG